MLKVFQLDYRPCSLLVYQDISHCSDVFVAFTWIVSSYVSTRTRIVRGTSCPKTDPRITAPAVFLLVTNNADSCFGMAGRAVHIKPFLTTFCLQGGFWTNQSLPHVTTQWGWVVLTVSDQWVQGVSLLVDYNKFDLFADLHTETDLWEGCVPVSFVSCESNPVMPPRGLYSAMLLQNKEE